MNPATATPTSDAPRPEGAAMPEPVAPGSRWETAWLLVQLAGDLLSVPFHLVAFLATRRRHKRRFLAALGRLPDDRSENPT